MNQTTCRTRMLAYRTTRVHKALHLAAVAGLAIMLAGPVAAASGQPGVPVSGVPFLQRATDADKSPQVVLERASGRLKLSGQNAVFTIEVGPDVTFGDIVEMMGNMPSSPINIVLDPELERRRGDIVPPITLRNVEWGAMIETLVWHISTAWTGLPNSVQVKFFGGAVMYPGSPSRLVGRLSWTTPPAAGNTAAAETAATVEFFAISDLLDGMKRAGDAKPVESLQTSLDLGLQALREKGNQPEITVHAETGLLIVRATPRQMGVIRSAINAVQARTQSMLRKVLAQEQVAAEFQSIESRIHEIEQWLVKSLRLAEEREKAGGLIDPSAPIRLREEAEKRTLRLRERASELQLAGAIARPALLDASPIGGPRLLELEAREAEALAKAAALAATDPVSAQLSGLVREQHSKIAEAERTLEGARRKLEDLVRKLQVVPVVKPAEGVK